MKQDMLLVKKAPRLGVTAFSEVDNNHHRIRKLNQTMA